MKELQAAVVAVVLATGAVNDVKFKKIPLWLIIGAGVIGIALAMINPMHSGMELTVGILVGVALIMVSVVTEGQIGLGDGLLFAVLGIYLGSSNVMLLTLSLVLCAMVAGVLFAIKRLGRKDRLPFVPFVMCAYVIQLIITVM